MSALGHPFPVRVIGGKLMFDKQYGDLVLTPAQIAERELLQALQ